MALDKIAEAESLLARANELQVHANALPDRVRNLKAHALKILETEYVALGLQIEALRKQLGKDG
jgi:hypothetical protein